MEFKKLVLISFILTIIVTVSFYIFILLEMKQHDTFPINYKELYKTCETGDLIYFRWGFVDLGYRLFSKFSHVGLVYKVNEHEIYILETHPEEDYTAIDEENGGVHIYDLKERVCKYTQCGGSCYLSKLNKNESELLTKNIKNDLKELQQIPFDPNFRYSYIYNLLYNLSIKHSLKSLRNILQLFKLIYPEEPLPMYCSQFLGHLLKKYNIIHEKENISIFSPSTFTTLNDKRGDLLYNNNLYKIVE